MAMKSSVRAARGAFLLAVAATVSITPAAAQYGAAISSDPSSRLADAMRTLAKSPKDFNALLAAGRASLEIGDTQSAAGFFGRAEEVHSASPWPAAGMGSLMVRMGDPASALTHFARAQQRGASQMAIALDRGLAFDLLGQQAQAQSDYRAALAGPDADEARRRLALSLAISRDIKGAGDTIEPLLQRRDPESLRVNAFVLALAGDREGARRTIDTAMPGAGTRFEPFFRLLPVLQPAEKAAAVHLGEFPKDASQRYAQAQPIASSPVMSVGGNSTPVVSRPAVQQPRTAATQAQRAPTQSQPQNRVAVREAPRRAVREVEPPNTYIASIRPSLDSSRYASTTRRQSATRSTPPSATAERRSEPEPEPRPVAEPAVDTASTAIEPATAPGFDLAQLLPVPSAGLAADEADANTATVELTPIPGASEEAAEPDPPVEAVPPPAPRPKVERAVPPAPRPKVERAAATKPKAEAAKRDETPASRYFVQLASGANAGNLPAEFRKIRARQPSLFNGKSVQISQGRDLFRLVVGPFKTREASGEFVNALARAGIDSFSYTAPQGLKFEKIASR